MTTSIVMPGILTAGRKDRGDGPPRAPVNRPASRWIVPIPLVLVLVLACAGSHAACDPPSSLDSWRGSDKAEHLAAGAGIALAAGFHTRDPWTGFWIGAGVTVAKELADRAGLGTCSWRDAAAGIAGSALGAYGSGFALRFTAAGTPMLTWHMQLGR